MKNAIKWIVGGIFIFASIGMIGMGGRAIISGILSLIAGLICLPPIIKIIESKLGNPLQSSLKYVVVIVCWILSAIIFPRTSATNPSIPSTSSPSSSISPDTTSKIDYEAKAKEAEQKLKEQLERELASDAFSKGLNIETYRGSVQSVQLGMIVFVAWAKIISDGELSTVPETKKLAATLKKKVIALQVKEFPKMRKAYIEEVAKKLWEENITVTVQGNSRAIVSFVGGAFANNKNIKTTQESLYDSFKLFRFRQIRYLWYKGQDDYTYYDLDFPKDSELLEISSQ